MNSWLTELIAWLLEYWVYTPEFVSDRAHWFV